MNKPWIVVVGGFLGAGKTTLLLAAAQELEKRGLRSAVVLNDQGEALVDTEYAGIRGLERGEVTGGCFCCRFSDLVHEMDKLRAHSPAVIFAEPVGSCTDISATTLQPLHEYSDSYRLAPYTVLVDPARARELLAQGAEPNMQFLFTKQLEEADVVCFTKSDLGVELPEIAAPHARNISAKTGAGVAAWLDEMLAGGISSGSHILEIDYEQYARAEAALAWLNLEVEIHPVQAQSSAMILGPLLDDLDRDFTAAHISIVHLKAIMNSPAGFLKAAVCANGEEPQVEGMLDASPALRHRLLLNLRAVGEAEQVRNIVERNLRALDVPLVDLRVDCFHPAPPNPEHRIAEARR
jgi:hypothetical protein